jgi:hypothetical protein
MALHYPDVFPADGRRSVLAQFPISVPCSVCLQTADKKSAHSPPPLLVKNSALNRRVIELGVSAAIAGHAIVMGCTLVTNNVREFSRVAGLAYEDWVH